MQDISVLTPPLLMCAAVLFAVGAFLRHEMNRKRPGDDDRADDDAQAPPAAGSQAAGKSAAGGSSVRDGDS